MNKIPCLLILLYLVANLPAQHQSHRFCYPLNIGDYWEYRREEIGGFVSTETREVIGDTIMPGGEVYQVIRKVAFGDTTLVWQRMSDSLRVFQWLPFDPKESLLFELEIKEGDSWTFPLFNSTYDSAFSLVLELGDTTLWSNTYKFAYIETFTLPDSTPLGFGTTHLLVDSIGIFSEGFEGGKLELQGAIINDKQYGTITSLRSDTHDFVEQSLSLSVNYPNPFNSSTTIEYELPFPAQVRISIFNVLGEKIKILLDGFEASGTHRVHWNGYDRSGLLVSSGLYFYVIEVNGVVRSQNTMVFLK